MSAAGELYRRHLAAVTTPDAAGIREAWEPDGVVEFPYAPADGVARLDGVEALVDYFTGLPLFGAFTFDGLVVWPVGRPDDDHGFLAEVHGSSTLRSTGAAYEQDYVVRFGVSDRGRLAWMREYWDPTRM